MKSRVLLNDLKLARKITLENLKGYRAKVYLFGSQATGKAHPYSDIDIAILPLQPLPPSLFFNLRDALEESDVVRTVDVVDLREVDEKFYQRVVDEGVLWTE
ncbi:MAG: type VII toxin-antitoxin system MntA family adenylyltransferase antitoxin [Chloroflexota bacterium]